jgi:hypothetical protein
MNTQTKKIVAKEFLLTIITIFLSLLFYLSLYTWNFYFKYQTRKIEKNIEQLSISCDSLMNPYTTKIENQKWFFESMSKEYNITNFNDYKEYWLRTEYLQSVDSISIRWNSIWDNSIIDYFKKLGFNNCDSLNKFILQNTITISDLENKSNAEKTQQEIDTLKYKLQSIGKKVLEKNDMIQFSLFFLIAIVFILFILRYIYKAIVWSLKTLKT